MIKSVLTLVLTLLYIARFFTTYSQTKLEYYISLFEDQYGFSITSYNAKDELAETAVSNRQEYILTLASEINKNNQFTFTKILSTYTNVILICDENTTFNGAYTFNCSPTNVVASGFDYAQGFAKSKAAELGNIYVIPETILTDPENRENLEYYFEAIKNSDKVISQTKDENTGSYFRTQTSFENISTILGFFGLLVWLLIASAIVHLFVDTPKTILMYFELKNLKKLWNLIITAHGKTVPLLTTTLLLLISFYIPLIITLNLKDNRGADLFYFIRYTVESFNTKIFIDAITQQYLFRLFFILYTLLIIDCAFILFLPQIVLSWVGFFKQISTIHLKRPIYKYLIPSLIILLLILNIFQSVKVIMWVSLFVTCLLVYALIITTRHNSITESYTKKELLVIILVVILVAAADKFIRINLRESDQVRSLISNDSKVITLPYTVRIENTSRFNEYLVNKNFPVFIDNYLVYTPNGDSIENTSIRNFTPDYPYYIQSGSIESQVSYILSNENLRNILSTTSPTNLITFKNPNLTSKNKLDMVIEFNCNGGTNKPKDIETVTYYTNAKSIESENNTLLYFPGCSSTSATSSYTMDISLPHTSSQYYAIYFKNLSPASISNIKFPTDKVEDSLLFYKVGVPFSVIVNNNDVSQKFGLVRNYFLEENFEFKVQLNPKNTNGFNIAHPINELINQKMLNAKSILWSVNNYVTIRSSLD